MFRKPSTVRVFSNGEMRFPFTYSIVHGFRKPAMLKFSIDGTCIETADFMLPIFENQTDDPSRPDVTYEQDVLICKTNYLGQPCVVAGLVAYDSHRFAVTLTTADKGIFPLFACEVLEKRGNLYEDRNALAQATKIAAEMTELLSPPSAVTEPCSPCVAIEVPVEIPENLASDDSEEWFDEGFDPQQVFVFVDGFCAGTSGSAGAAYLIRSDDFFYHEAQALPHTAKAPMTAVIAKLTAVSLALSKLPFGCEVTVYSDSQHVINPLAFGWLHSWQENNWVKPDGTAVEHIALWEQLFELEKDHEITWSLIKNNSGNEDQAICNCLAVNAAQSAQKQGHKAKK